MLEGATHAVDPTSGTYYFGGLICAIANKIGSTLFTQNNSQTTSELTLNDTLPLLEGPQDEQGGQVLPLEALGNIHSELDA